MKKIQQKEISKNQVTTYETDNNPEEPDMDPFLKKKRIQNIVLRRIIDQINEEGGENPPVDSQKELTQ